MDEIFLQDYANNVAQAQDPFGIAAVQAQPGFENYQPSFANQSLTPMGLEITPGPDTQQLPDFREVAGNVIKNRALDYAAKKLGLEGLKGNVLSSVIGANALNYSNPIGAYLTVSSVLPDSVKGIANVLRNKRANKAIQRDIKRDSQGSATTYPTKTMSMQPTKQDEARGSMPSKTPTPSTSYSAPQQTSGPGGLHNYD